MGKGRGGSPGSKSVEADFFPIYWVHFGIWGEKGGGLDLMCVQNKSYLTMSKTRGGSRGHFWTMSKRKVLFLMASLILV